MPDAVLVWNPNPTLDLVSQVPSFEVGAVHRADVQTFSPGGKGTLVLRTLAALGVDCLGPTPLAGPSGKLVEDLMRRESLPVEITEVTGATRAAVSIVDRAARFDSVVNGPGPNTGTAEWRSHCQMVARHIGEGRFGTFVAAGRPPLDGGEEDLIDLCEQAAASGMRVALDVSEPSLKPALATKPWLVKVNREEAEACARSIRADLVAELMNLGAQNVLLTDGPCPIRGSLQGRALTAKPPNVRLRSAVGCGDCFLGGLLRGLLDNPDDPAEAVRFATAVGAAAAETLVPGKFVLSRAEELRRQVEISVGS